ncbi:hypothetical protein [Mesorhizobium caraganae]|uniref:hypothetical protein n=1 Tax=Mesorhizobium caraganae TaxID=483206 RepID=UPI003ED0E08F
MTSTQPADIILRPAVSPDAAAIAIIMRAALGSFDWMPVAALPVVKLHCFQSNTGARRFHERHGFRAEAFGDGTTNEEGLPDIFYVRRA